MIRQSGTVINVSGVYKSPYLVGDRNNLIDPKPNAFFKEGKIDS